MECNGKIFAVLISGGMADRDGYDEFWNDLVLMREALITNRFGIQVNAENIFVLYGDTGNDFFDNTHSKYNYPSCTPTRKRQQNSLTDFPAAYDKVKLIFDGLAGKNTDMPRMTDNDTLFVWTFGHGFRHGDSSWLFLADGTILHDYDFAALVNQIPCKKRIICMQQCFSGGFIRFLSDAANPENINNIVLTSCYETEFANRSPKNNDVDVSNNIYHHGEFDLYLYEYLRGSTLTGQEIDAGTGRNGLKPGGAYDYINNNHVTPENPQYWDSQGRVGNIPAGDYIRASWNLGYGKGSICIEFTYRIPDMYKEEEHKLITMSINGVRKHIFRINASEYAINPSNSGPETANSRFILNGVFKADYYHRMIYFTGNIKIKEQILYCPAQGNYSASFTPIYPIMDSKNGLSCKMALFNWI